LGGDLATAEQIKVIQENGSSAQFVSDGNGGYIAPDRVRATLVGNADGSFTFTREKKQVYNFDATGRLASLQDLNGNTVTLTYANGKLAHIDGSGEP
jgi:threonine aldolase